MLNEKALIVTFHSCPNYGAFLQLMGLHEFLKGYFKEVEVLDYQPEALMKDYKYINTYSVGSIVKSLVALPKFFCKRRKFSRILKEKFNLTPLYREYKDIESTDATYCFLGSDQIWNPEITRGFDPVYFGQIPSKDKMKRISYAASIGNENVDDRSLDILKSKLSEIDFISVREQSAQELLTKITPKDVSVVLDPTLLAGVDTFRQFVRKEIHRKPYLFIYSLNNASTTNVRCLGHRIAKKLGLEVIEINGNKKGFSTPNTHRVIYDAGVEDFVSMLANSDYVVTDSFHGTAFSLLFHRPFITIPHKTRGGRMKNLLSIAGLTTRLDGNPTDDVIAANIAWDEVDGSIEKARKASQQFIERAILNR